MTFLGGITSHLPYIEDGLNKVPEKSSPCL